MQPKDEPNYDTRSRWHNIVPGMRQVRFFPLNSTKPSAHLSYQIFGSSPPPLQSGSYMFYALEPSSQYEVVIAGYNDWGWAANSEPFFFSTRATGINEH